MQRPVLAAGLLALAFVPGCTPGGAPKDGLAAFPTKIVTIICPWAPGGGTDRVSRAMADGLHQQYGKQFVVVNKTGGSGDIGHRAGSQARPDGHTLTMITFELSTMAPMGISRLTYRDFQPLIQINSDAAAIVVGPHAAWKNIRELLDHIKANPGKLKMSGTATGGAWDLARAGMLLAAGLPVESVRWIPNKGAGPSLVDLLGGHIDAVCCSVPEVASQLEAGQVRVLAVMAEQRLELFPDIPTLKENAIDWVAIGWRGLAVPKETPREVVDSLAAKCQAVVESSDFKVQMQKSGFGVTIRVRDEFTEYLRDQEELWKPVIEAAGYAKS